MSEKKKYTGKKLSKAAVRTLGRRTFQAGRTQNLLISMAVVIVTILITAACSVFYNIQRFGQMQELKEAGAMTDVVLSGPDEQQMAVLSESGLIQQPLFVSHKVGRLVGESRAVRVKPLPVRRRKLGYLEPPAFYGCPGELSGEGE